MSSPFTCRRIILPGANPLAWLVISTTYPVTAIDGESVTLSPDSGTGIPWSDHMGADCSHRRRIRILDMTARRVELELTFADDAPDQWWRQAHASQSIDVLAGPFDADSTIDDILHAGPRALILPLAVFAFPTGIGTRP